MVRHSVKGGVVVVLTREHHLIGWKRVDVEEHWFNGWSPSNT
jgi:hypothetical protein